MTIKGEYLIEKRNMLNEIRANGLSLQELRFFSIYLSKINSRDLSTRVVRFTLNDFQRIMEFSSHFRRKDIINATDRLLCKIVRIPIENRGSIIEDGEIVGNGYTSFQLFKRCVLDKDDKGEWYIEIDAHDQALPLMFQFKNRYFTYKLWNALKLKSSNQLRMYEILKQYEHMGERIISIKELKELLGIEQVEYSRFGDFKLRVLDACQQALNEYTDITFTYEPTGKKGQGGKVYYLKFTISKNKNYIDQLSLDDFIDQQSIKFELMDDVAVGDDGYESYFEMEVYPFFVEACENEFDLDEIQVLYNLLIQIFPFGSSDNRQLKMFDYLKRKYDELKWRASQTKIKNRIGYLKKLIEVDLDI